MCDGLRLRLVGALFSCVLGVAGTGGASAPELGPLISGSVSYVGGVHVATDYVYDDGADPENAADFVQLQVSRDASGDWHVRAILETLLDPNVPLVGVGFDLDGSSATGAAAPPGGGWTPQGSLGLEALVAISSDGTIVLHWNGTQWSSAAQLSSSIDPIANTLDASIPGALLAAASPTVQLVGLVGPVSGGSSWLAGGSIHDLAYVKGEAPSGLQNAKQSAVLAGTAPASEATALVELALLDGAATQLALATSPGWHTRLYHSGLDLGEGIGDAIVTGPNRTPVPVGDLYAGPYQPYLVRVPDPLPQPAPIVISMHGFGGSHTSQVGLFGPGRFDPAALVVSPLGRGGTTFYFGAAEQDVMDAFRDALASYGADADRVVLSGVSMGGFGTFRMGVRYPDQWSALLPLIGTGGSAQNQFPVVPPELIDLLAPPEGFPGGSSELLENIRNLPMRMINGQLDPIVQPELPEEDALALEALGYDFRAWMLLRRQHEVVPAISGCVLDELLGFVRESDPARVTFSVEPAIFHSDPNTGLDLRYQSAYWVTDVEVAPEVDDPGEMGTLDAVSLARSDRERSGPLLLLTGDNTSAGADLCGPDPDVMTDDAWRMRGRPLSPDAPQAVSNALDVTLTRITAATLDLARASLHTGETLTIVAHGDGATDLRLLADWGAGPVFVKRNGAPFAQLLPENGAILLSDDMNGTFVYELDAPDVDADGVGNEQDNCPLTPNPDQTDSGGIASPLPDGIGDACQCGDVSDEGIVNGQDGFFITRFGLGLEDALFRAAAKCDVTGNGLCNGQDGFFVTREALGLGPNPLFGQRCPAADPSTPCPYCP